MQTGITNIDKELIQQAFNEITTYNLQAEELQFNLQQTIEQLNQGTIRVAYKKQNSWHTEQWIKQAILLYLYSASATATNTNITSFYDKLPLKFHNYQQQDFINDAIRVVPPAHARYGSFIDKQTVLMPSYINIGAYIGKNCMIDTWSTIGSCAQIGNNVHISGGAGIGGVLEPIQANPTIIENNCFIGARSEIVEGVIVEENSVISMGVFIGQSTKIFNKATGSISYGKIPAGSVVIPGNIPAKDQSHGTYAAIIIKQITAATKAKVSINDLLRN